MSHSKEKHESAIAQMMYRYGQNCEWYQNDWNMGDAFFIKPSLNCTEFKLCSRPHVLTCPCCFLPLPYIPALNSPNSPWGAVMVRGLDEALTGSWRRPRAGPREASLWRPTGESCLRIPSAPYPRLPHTPGSSAPGNTSPAWWETGCGSRLGSARHVSEPLPSQ